MSQETDEKEEVTRMAAALRTAIELSRVSHRHIERSLHLSTGYLTRILKGEVQLQVRHVLGVCRVIGLPPGHLFAALFPQTASGRRAPEMIFADLLERLEQLRVLLKEEGSK